MVMPSPSCWGPSTESENGPQTAALMRHMFMKGIRFGIVSWDQAGSQMTYDIGKGLEKELHKQLWRGLGALRVQAAKRGSAQGHRDEPPSHDGT